MHGKAPNPWLFVALSVSSFATFYILVKHRAKTSPASLQPRQLDHPLIPPHRKESP